MGFPSCGSLFVGSNHLGVTCHASSRRHVLLGLLVVAFWEVCLLTVKSSTDEKNCRMLNIEPAKHRLMPAAQKQ